MGYFLHCCFVLWSSSLFCFVRTLRHFLPFELETVWIFVGKD
jgi:hypothetical protein